MAGERRQLHLRHRERDQGRGGDDHGDPFAPPPLGFTTPDARILAVFRHNLQRLSSMNSRLSAALIRTQVASGKKKVKLPRLI